MDFQYRCVAYGTSFHAAEGVRPETAPGSGPETDEAMRALYENEIAVDVGGVCWGDTGCEMAVLDHHFPRRDGRPQYPAAACAVLPWAGQIRARFAGKETVWLVSHTSPDLDALCSLYLIRRILEAETEPADWGNLGLRADGWGEEKGEIRWFGLSPVDWKPETWWQVALASCAAHQDQGKRLAVRTEFGLNAYVQAWIERRKGETGLYDFFREAERQIREHGKHPLVDSLFDELKEFADETKALAREPALYAADRQRARLVVVSVPRRRAGFVEQYKKQAGTPLTGPDGVVDAVHLTGGEDLVQVDGLYLRDPRSMLFKEWARMDREHSPGGEGFVFTLVAISGGRREGRVNQTNYFVSVDPEYRIPLTLYRVWARLQAAEMAALVTKAPDLCAERRAMAAEIAADPALQKMSKEEMKRYDGRRAKAVTRTGYEGRAGQDGPLWGDPWFDGVNFGCTLVATPNDGTWIEPSGTRDDLTDDGVARLVRAELEHGHYGPVEKIRDVPLKQGGKVAHRETGGAMGAVLARIRDEPMQVEEGSCRFGCVALRGVEWLGREGRRDLARQIGVDLWQLLHGRDEGLPRDFDERHLVVENDWVGVWHRSAGLMVAYREGAASRVEEMEKRFDEMAALAQAVDAEVSKGPEVIKTDPAKAVADTERLSFRVVEFKAHLKAVDLLLLRRYFEHAVFVEWLQELSTQRAMAHDRDQRERNTKTLQAFATSQKQFAESQEQMEVVEVLIVTLYGMEVVHLMGELLARGSHRMAQVTAVCGFLFAILGKQLFAKSTATKARGFAWAVVVLMFVALVAVFAVPGWLEEQLHHRDPTAHAVERLVDGLEADRQERKQVRTVQPVPGAGGSAAPPVAAPPVAAKPGHP